MGSEVLGTENFILIYGGNESNTLRIGFLINRKYKQTIMNFETVDERIWSLRMRGILTSLRAVTCWIGTLFTINLRR
jgi:hypothetical protein